MSIVTTIEADDQTVVVAAEDDYVAALIYFQAVRDEDLDGVILLGLREAEQLAAALTEAINRVKAAA